LKRLVVSTIETIKCFYGFTKFAFEIQLVPLHPGEDVRGIITGRTSALTALAGCLAKM
jgi:hypothetical protein